jgi:uncharacterized protein (TIGR02145 family)
MPDDPVGIVASVSQPADNFGSGESSVSFTVTFDSNVKQLVKENNAPVVLKLLASYTDNTFKTRMASLNIRVQDAACYCPALVPTSIHPSGWLTFMCRNLGADYEIRSVDDLGNIDVNNFREYHGDWYRFGVHTASLVNNGQYEGSSTISNWTTSSHTNYPFYEGNTNWPSAESGAFGNPCPDGWRLPTYPEWRAVINMSSTNNTIIRYVGTVVNNNWIEDNSATPSGNYNNILRIGDHLFLPAAGYRLNTDGKLTYRGYGCFYWSSTYAAVDKAYEMYAYSSYNKGMGDAERSYGFSVRCVQAE